MSHEDPADLLTFLWGRWEEDGRALSADDWARPTRCGDWSVAALYAHVGLGVPGLAALLDRTEEHAPTTDAAALLRRFHDGSPDAKALAERNAAHAAGDAQGHEPAELIARFADAPGVLARARGQQDAVVDYFRHGHMTVAEAMRLRVMEAATHLLDLDDALGRPPSVPAESITAALDVLLAIPSPLALLEAATGRGTGAVFPVIS